MRLLVVVILAALLAGCSGNQSAGDSGNSPGASSEGTAAIPLPEWSVRDFWIYTVNGDRTAYIVTGETAQDWEVGTNNAERAFQNLRNDISRLGPQRKNDLAGSQGTDRVEFFKWPLQDGQTWTTQWDQQAITISSNLTGGKANLSGRDASGAVVYRYTYDPQVRWLSEISRYDSNGTELINLKLTESGHNYTGDVVDWELKTIVNLEGPGLAHAAPFEVPAGATDLWMSYDLVCPTSGGGYAISVAPVNPPTGSGFAKNGQCTDVHFAGPAVNSPAAGTWSAVINAGGQNADLKFTLLLRTLIVTQMS